MADNKVNSFPQTESPPSPGSTPDNVLTADVKSYAAENNVTKSQSPLNSLKEITSYPKKNNLKIILFVLLGLFLLVGLMIGGFVYYRSRTVRSIDVKGEIVWWGVQHEADIYKPLIDKYVSDHPGVKIRYEKQSAKDYRERLAGRFTAGMGPDIFEIHDSWPAMFRGNLAKMPAEAMSVSDFKNSFYPVFATNFISNNEIVGIPLEYDALTLFINEDVFASAVKSPPKTWDDLKSLADPKEAGGLTIKDKNTILLSGVALGETINVDHWPEIIALMMFQNKVNPSKPSGKAMTDVITFYTLFKKSGVWDDSLPNSTTAFAQGKLAMYFAPTYRASEIARTNSALKFKTVPLPQLPKLQDTDPDYAYATYWANSVWEGSKDKKEAWEFLKYMSQSDTLIEVNKNIKRTESIERLYPRPEMNIVFKDHEILASIASLAPLAKSWYLADNTNDGPDGVNSKLKTVYEEEIIRGGGDKNLAKLTGKIKDILSAFSISIR